MRALGSVRNISACAVTHFNWIQNQNLKDMWVQCVKYISLFLVVALAMVLEIVRGVVQYQLCSVVSCCLLWCVVWCTAVCCAVLCCAVLCCAVLYCIGWCVALRCVVLYSIGWCGALCGVRCCVVCCLLSWVIMLVICLACSAEASHILHTLSPSSLNLFCPISSLNTSPSTQHLSLSATTASSLNHTSSYTNSMVGDSIAASAAVGPIRNYPIHVG